MTSNRRMINEWWNWKRSGRKRPWRNWRHYPGLECPEKTKKNFRIVGCLSRDSYPVLKVIVLPSHLIPSAMRRLPRAPVPSGRTVHSTPATRCGIWPQTRIRSHGSCVQAIRELRGTVVFPCFTAGDIAVVPSRGFWIPASWPTALQDIMTCSHVREEISKVV
jgi:hypothetical protein